MILYLYTFNYPDFDESAQADADSPGVVLLEGENDLMSTADNTSLESKHRNAPDTIDSQTFLAMHESEGLSTEINMNQCDLSKSENMPVGALLYHLRVYALADKYEIKYLKKLACDRSAKCLDYTDLSLDVFEVVRSVYPSTPDSDRGLSDLVVAYIYREIPVLVHARRL